MHVVLSPLSRVGCASATACLSLIEAVDLQNTVKVRVNIQQQSAISFEYFLS